VIKSYALAAAIAAVLMPASAALAQAAAPKSVSRADYVKGIDTRFGNIDANHDGFLTTPELTAAEAKASQQLTAARNQAARTQFNQADTNKDGKLSIDEFLAAQPPIKARETPAQLISMLDGNKDGKISAEEFRNSQMAPFNKLDANHDGVVTTEEYRKGSGK